MRAMRRAMTALAALGILLIAPDAAWPQAPLSAARTASPTIEEMRARDRFANPKTELEAWTQFSGPILADPASSRELRLEVRGRLAIAHFYAGSFAQGWSEAEAGLKLAEGTGAMPFLAELYAYASLLSTELREPARALALAQKSLELAQRQFGEESAEAGLAYNSLAYQAFPRGDYVRTTELMCRAAELARRHLPPTDPMVSNNLISCAISHYFLDDEEAAALIQDAAAFAHQHLPPSHPVLALALNSSGGILLALGRYAEAEEVTRRELEFSRATLGDHPDGYNPISTLARALMLQGKYGEAEPLLREGISYAHRTQHGSDPSKRGQSILNLARLYEQTGADDKAIEQYRLGLDQLRRDMPAEHPDVGTAEVGMARVLARTGRLAEALPLAEAGRRKLTGGLAETHKLRLDGDIRFAAILARVGRHAEAFEIARQATGALEKKLLDLASSRTELVSISPLLVEAFSEFAYIALRAGHEEEAARAAQLASLSELSLVNAELAARNAARASGAGPLLDQIRRRRADAGRLRRELARAEAGAGGDAGAIARQLGEAETAVEALAKEVEQRFPDYRKLGRPVPVDLASMRAALRPDQALILPLSLADRSATIAITRDGLTHAEGPGSARAIRDAIRAIRDSIDGFALSRNPESASFDAASAHRLYGLIFPANLESALKGRDELLFPASGPLAAMSPALLLRKMLPKRAKLSAGDWLIRSKAIAVVSDFSLAGAAPDAASGGFLGVGSPGHGNGFLGLPPLPRAREELAQMQKAFSPKTSLLLTGDEASERNLKQVEFARFSVAAFATHGLTGGQIEGVLEPALVLTPPERATAEDDGLLSATEIAQLSMPVDWVILSACNSGSGSGSSGGTSTPTYSGLARAFRLAGARSLLLSHWRVRDDVASRLTVETVEGAAAGLGRGEALRKAMLRLIADRSVAGAGHPAVWGPFILIGN